MGITPYLSREDITENLVVIKINNTYRKSMSEKELYDVTRGFWKRKIESVEPAEYALAVCKQVVVEVYRIYAWYKAEEKLLDREKYPYNAERHKGRIFFEGEVAKKEIREKYIGKSVSNLYKWGEANPVKLFLANNA